MPKQPCGQVRRIAGVEFAPARGKQIRPPVQQRGQARPLQPARHEHPRCRGVHRRNRDACPARRLAHADGEGNGDAVGERGCDLGLDVPFPHIIEFLDDPAGQLAREPGDVQPGEPGHHPRGQPGLAQIRAQRAAAAGGTAPRPPPSHPSS